MKKFEEVLFEPHKILRFSELGKRDIHDKFGDLIKQIQEIVLHLFDKSDEKKISCKVVSTYDKDNDDWVDGIHLPNGEFSKLDIKQLSELVKHKKSRSSLSCLIRFTDNKEKKIKLPVINGYITFIQKDKEPSMPWENKLERFEQFINDGKVWAIFILRHGHKFFITSVNINDTFGGWEYIKYNDPKTLKFTLDQAKELVDKNKRIEEEFGIVNGMGIQLTKGKYDNIWKKGPIK